MDGCAEIAVSGSDYEGFGVALIEAMALERPIVSTGVGGIAMGEMTYRLSSTILDNTATGAGRIWREIAATAVSSRRRSPFHPIITS